MILAPIINKPKAGSVVKRGAGGFSKPSGGKTGSLPGFEGKSSSSSNKKPTPAIGSSGKPASLIPASSSSKSYSSSSYSSSNNNYKTRFGILWIPSKRHNKKKDLVYNPHRDDYRERDRSPSMYNLMSGDSDRHHKKKEEDATLLVSDKPKAPAANVATAGAMATDVLLSETVASTSPTDKQEQFIQHDKGDSKDAAGDTNDNDYLENNSNNQKSGFESEDKATEWDKDKLSDKVDSVYLRPPPPHKARSSASTVNDEEDCGIKCLYYTLQCCDCVLM